MLSFNQLREASKTRQQEWDPSGTSKGKLWRAVELGGEMAEMLIVLNTVKKLVREESGMPGSRSTVENLAKELADIIICSDLLAQQFGIDLGAVVVKKFNETSHSVGMKTMLPEDS